MVSEILMKWYQKVIILIFLKKNNMLSGIISNIYISVFVQINNFIFPLIQRFEQNPESEGDPKN